MGMAFRDPFAELQTELDRMLERAFAGSGAGSGVYPPVNLFDAGEEYVVKAEVPGVLPDQISVELDGDTLVLGGERAFSEPKRDVAHHRRERPQGKFRRVVRLPGRLAADEVRAEYRDGVLTVRVPKAKETRPRRVEIKPA
jgi:HSP20 family protein